MDLYRIRPMMIITIFVVGIGSNPAYVWAQESGHPEAQSPFIQQFDQDGDGLISVNEFPGPESDFNRLDGNKDGAIEAAEAPRRPPHHGPDETEILSERDSDGDGQLSASEFPGPADRFDQLDSDGDGLLSVEELRAVRPGPPPGDRFEQDDADRDGLVSQAEFGGPEGLFERLDTDGDGYISPEEARPDRR